ncbi:MAG: hypothetical protein ACRC6I_18965, partial [Paracoccaceae bacterium]
MSLNYDFDIVPKQAASTDGGSVTMILTEARFRDAETLAELQKAPEAVRRWLTGAGFGLMAHRSDVPAGHYAARDEIGRLELMQRLTLTMKDYDLPKGRVANWSAFVITEFVEAMAAARPMRDETLLVA